MRRILALMAGVFCSCSPLPDIPAPGTKMTNPRVQTEVQLAAIDATLLIVRASVSEAQGKLPILIEHSNAPLASPEAAMLLSRHQSARVSTHVDRDTMWIRFQGLSESQIAVERRRAELLGGYVGTDVKERLQLRADDLILLKSPDESLKIPFAALDEAAVNYFVDTDYSLTAFEPSDSEIRQGIRWVLLVEGLSPE